MTIPMQIRAIACGLAVALGATTALAEGGSRVDVPSPAPEKSPEQLAAEHYNEGLAYRDQAWKLQRKLAEATQPEAKREKTERKIARAYEQAIEKFAAAIENKADFHQAYASLGYALRMTGDYASALEAYDRAIELDPDYLEALEYRGEAYLGLNRISDAQNAYRLLQQRDAKLAADLLGAMQAWIAARRAEPAGLDLASLDGLARWVEDREQASAAESSQRKAWTW